MRIFNLLFLIFIGVGAVATLRWSGQLPSIGQSDRSLPKYWSAPDFELTDANGVLFSARSLQGKVWIAHFFFTSCGGICPAISAEIKKLEARNPALSISSISVDPARDNPERLLRYASALQADPARWHFLTGPESTITGLLESGFKLGDGGSPTDHTTRLTLVDQDGMIRGFYDGLDPKEMARLQSDIERVMAQGS